MENSFRLLIVEDDKNEIVNYKDNLELFNEDNKKDGFIIEADFNTTLQDGINAIKNNKYDGAIVDLKLNQDNIEAAEGNVIIKSIVGNLRMPAIVVSGFMGDLDPELKNETSLLRFYERGSIEIVEIFNVLKKIYNTGITKILGEDGLIIKELTKIFWERISTNLEYWISESDNTTKIEKIVSRYIINHLKEGFETDENGEFEVYHSSEFYIVPPIKQNYFTGDIVEKVGINYIILMPPCDMATNGKVQNIVLGKIEDINFSQIKDAKKKLEKDNSDDKAKFKILSLLNNTYSLNYHFLPQTNAFSGGFIDFRKIKSVKVKELKVEYKRVGTISSEFIKDIISRFSQYYSRQGQPNLDINAIYKKILL
ncbi:hypothetical protein K9O30_02980 [Clostridium bowmanii]|uniref:hypothetical protein n=1 Tax=Clostridium bowmanii TaxID=132925 RepID=UPI001C0C3314|nr:hypothetical protein [Clostridium bowmanii]MBU3188329.1 hypothetical protein [Clostridium bowmanii]MCA1072717.1 hypothetical protein [Clostridium bowmanii]